MHINRKPSSDLGLGKKYNPKHIYKIFLDRRSKMSLQELFLGGIPPKRLGMLGGVRTQQMNYEEEKK